MNRSGLTSIFLFVLGGIIWLWIVYLLLWGLSEAVRAL